MPRLSRHGWVLVIVALLLGVALWSSLSAGAAPPAPSAAVAEDDLGFTTVEIVPSADTIISYWYPDRNYSTGGSLLFRTNDETAVLFQFPLTAIPSQTEQVEIAEATLRVYASTATNVQAVPGAACPISRTWAASQVTWVQAANGAPWQAPGANGPTDLAPYCGPQLDFFKAGIWYDVDVTEMVRAWVNGSLPNRGMVLKSMPGGLVGYEFVSSEHLDAAHRPYLRVVYGIMPPPTPTPTPLPRVDVSKTGPTGPLTSGNWATIDYTITVANPGGDDVTGVVVTDVLPLGTEFVSSSDGGEVDNAKQYVVWQVGDLAAGETQSLGLTLGLQVWTKGDGMVVNVVRGHCAECVATDQDYWEIPVVAPPIRTYYLPEVHRLSTW